MELKFRGSFLDGLTLLTPSAPRVASFWDGEDVALFRRSKVFVMDA